jgi:hypothetical protein
MCSAEITRGIDVIDQLATIGRAAANAVSRRVFQNGLHSPALTLSFLCVQQHRKLQ